MPAGRYLFIPFLRRYLFIPFLAVTSSIQRYEIFDAYVIDEA